jgi:Arc/MetJ family transcription regulator
MKTTIDVDREVADEAAAILGTETLKETVNVALREVVREERLKQLADSVRDGTLPVPTLEELARLRGRVA